MILTIETGREEDGRWFADVLEIPGAILYGANEADAIRRVKCLALQAIADQIEHQELEPVESIAFVLKVQLEVA